MIKDIIKRFDKKEYRMILGGVSIFLVLIVFIAILNFSHALSDNVTNDQIKDFLNNKDEVLLYVYNSKSRRPYNRTLTKVLNDASVNYLSYDVSIVADDEYEEFLKVLELDKNVVTFPALIYLKDGMMYSNLFNINNNKDSIESFITDYDLTTLR